MASTALLRMPVTASGEQPQLGLPHRQVVTGVLDLPQNLAQQRRSRRRCSAMFRVSPEPGSGGDRSKWSGVL
ncbi:hypothetical protein P3102_15850 [Amycolatopsis sp. QT-25]|uniref:hypothetical protein n=1 Tax=Amycolatopsis sp. QT-25 TaxID=3034022 RepID=UPI0023ECCD54|nr:hypothetical protein [Amycolatopsis sp. QT-25]WET82569.1 hypothetical protein P3102_15850 [Amycolatopsis sp. QT-25]